VIRAEALRLQAELQQWEDGVQATRREGYFVNFFALQQVGATSTDTDLDTGFIPNGSDAPADLGFQVGAQERQSGRLQQCRRPHAPRPDLLRRSLCIQVRPDVMYTPLVDPFLKVIASSHFRRVA
jgi:hypothetical protein